eukprot:11757970-Ditylum_brightwellii.AAC.1
MARVAAVNKANPFLVPGFILFEEGFSWRGGSMLTAMKKEKLLLFVESGALHPLYSMFDLDEEAIRCFNTITAEVLASKQMQQNASYFAYQISHLYVILVLKHQTIKQGRRVAGEALKKNTLDASNNNSASYVKGCSENMSGPRPQDIVPWGGFRHEPDPCPAWRVKISNYTLQTLFLSSDPFTGLDFHFDISISMHIK